MGSGFRVGSGLLWTFVATRFVTLSPIPRGPCSSIVYTQGPEEFIHNCFGTKCILCSYMGRLGAEAPGNSLLSSGGRFRRGQLKGQPGGKA